MKVMGGDSAKQLRKARELLRIRRYLIFVNYPEDILLGCGETRKEK